MTNFNHIAEIASINLAKDPELEAKTHNRKLLHLPQTCQGF